MYLKKFEYDLFSENCDFTGKWWIRSFDSIVFDLKYFSLSLTNLEEFRQIMLGNDLRSGFVNCITTLIGHQFPHDKAGIAPTIVV